MTEQEAIKEPKHDCAELGKAVPRNTNDKEMVDTAYGMAISALEKQIPKKPIRDNLYACPNCHTIMLRRVHESREKFCKECGQALDWSEE